MPNKEFCSNEMHQIVAKIYIAQKFIIGVDIEK